jgi:hypothetical protein
MAKREEISVPLSSELKRFLERKAAEQDQTRASTARRWMVVGARLEGWVPGESAAPVGRAA